MFLSEEYLNNEDRYNLFSEFGMYVEAAKAAFDWKNVEALTSLEAMCVGRDDILKSIPDCCYTLDVDFSVEPTLLSLEIHCLTLKIHCLTLNMHCLTLKIHSLTLPITASL